jgi:hypothetical protein
MQGSTLIRENYQSFQSDHKKLQENDSQGSWNEGKEGVCRGPTSCLSMVAHFAHT